MEDDKFKDAVYLMSIVFKKEQGMLKKIADKPQKEIRKLSNKSNANIYVKQNLESAPLPVIKEASESPNYDQNGLNTISHK